MNAEKQKTAPKPNKGDALLFARLLVTVLLATGAALVFRRSSGILAMLPVCTLICLAAAFVNVGPVVRCAAFGAIVFAFNTVEQDDILVTITFTLLCVFAVAAFGWGVSLLRNKKKAPGICVIALGLAASVALNIFFVGNPVKAIKAEKRIDGYIAEVYPETRVLGFLREGSGMTDEELKVVFSGIYYDRAAGAYVKDAVCRCFPTEKRAVSVAANGEGPVSDGFCVMLADAVSEAYRSAYADLMMSFFPGKNYGVECAGIYGFPEKSVLEGGSRPVTECMCFNITVGGVQTAQEFTEAVKNIAREIDGSGLEYHRLTFTAGIGSWYRRYTEKKNTEPRGSAYIPKATLAPVGAGARFNAFLDLITRTN